jgi:putative glutamine amidotransferase
MYHLEIDSALKLFEECDGLLLTGGTDIYPGYYGKANDTSRCWEPDFKRDSIEIALIYAAMQQEKPILGICRGLQLLNVYLGGSLYIDLPSDLDTVIKHQCDNKYECFHDVSIAENSLLFEFAGQSAGLVNSNHHQGIEQLATPLIGIAYTNDGLIESIQWENKNKKPFLLGVQWHPERMDFDNPLSGEIAKRYLKEVTLNLSGVK